MQTPGMITGILAGIGLAAASGFRVFLPLFVLSIAAKTGLTGLNEKFAWLGSDTALIILGVATLTEIAAYLIPWVDHLLDMLAFPLAGIAGTLAVASTLQHTDPALTWTLALIAGGGTATAVQASTSAGRVASTSATGGLANPLFAAGESLVSFLFSVLALAAPLAAFLLVAAVLYFIYRLAKRKKNTPAA